MTEVKNNHPHNQVCCECGVELIFVANDLKRIQSEPDYYYIICPMCGQKIWLLRNEKLDKMWNSVHSTSQNEE